MLLRILSALLLFTCVLPAAEPDFPLASGPSGPTSLAAIGGARRKLVVFSTEGPVMGISGMKWNAIRELVCSPALAGGLKGRETLIILATRAEVRLPEGVEQARVPADAIAAARTACGLRPGPAALVLIGKDGKVNDTWTGAVPVEVIFNAIDAMVMRGQEKAPAEQGKK